MQTLLFISFEPEEELIYNFFPCIWVLTPQIMSCNSQDLSLKVCWPSWSLTQNCNIHLSGAISKRQSRFGPKTAKDIYRLLLFSFASNSWHLEISDIHRWTRDWFYRPVLVHFSFSENTKTHNKTTQATLSSPWSIKIFSLPRLFLHLYSWFSCCWSTTDKPFRWPKVMWDPARDWIVFLPLLLQLFLGRCISEVTS